MEGVGKGSGPTMADDDYDDDDDDDDDMQTWRDFTFEN